MDRVHRLDRIGLNPLDAIFAPRAVAVIGATEQPGSAGEIAIRNLRASQFPGAIYAVNPRREHVYGIKSYPSIGALPRPPDLALITTPAATVPAIIANCGEVGVPGAIIVSDGFSPTDPMGPSLALQTLNQARFGQVCLLGPESWGAIRPGFKLNASTFDATALAGQIGLFSQSKALTAAILDWSLRIKVGFSLFGSVGTMLDVGWGDLISYLGDDQATKSIVLVMNTVGDARAFLSAAQSVALVKPIIVIKATQADLAAQNDSQIHPKADSDEAFDAACHACGIFRAHTIADVFALADALGRQPRPAGVRLGIVSETKSSVNLAVDALQGQGGTLACLTPESIASLGLLSGVGFNETNLVELVPGTDMGQITQAVQITANDAGSDGVLMIFAAESLRDPVRSADLITLDLPSERKPILISGQGDGSIDLKTPSQVSTGVTIYDYPDTAARIFVARARHAENLQCLAARHSLYPSVGDCDASPPVKMDLFDQAQSEGRKLLDEVESQRLLAQYGLRTHLTRIALTEDEAVDAARAIGFPVAIKLYSKIIESRSEIGGVRLNLPNSDAVRAAFWGIEATVNQMFGPGPMLGVLVQSMVHLDMVKFAISSQFDPVFGPVVCLARRAVSGVPSSRPATALPPLTMMSAERLIAQVKVVDSPESMPDQRSTNLDDLAHFLVGFSQMIFECPQIKAIDGMLILEEPDQITAFDGQVRLHDDLTTNENLLRSAIRPYPLHYLHPWTSKDGGPVVIRPIRTDDEALVRNFYASSAGKPLGMLHSETVRQIWASTADRLVRLCNDDYSREITLVVDRLEPWTELHAILGIGHLRQVHGTNRAEFAIRVDANHHGRGFGTELVRRLIAVAADLQCGIVSARISAANHAMIRICEKLGFQVVASESSELLDMTYDVLYLIASSMVQDNSSHPASPTEI